MTETTDYILARELRLAGAKPAELKELLPIAKQLSRLPKTKHRTHRPFYARKVAWLTTGLVGGLVAIFIGLLILPILSPVNPLYGVQKQANDVAIDIVPSYRDSVMMKQATRINQLVAAHSQTKPVVTLLHDYRTVATAYIDGGTPNYSTLHYCRSTLEQAAAHAPTDQREAITHSLQSVSSV